jgi:hypothetical protein
MQIRRIAIGALVFAAACGPKPEALRKTSGGGLVSPTGPTVVRARAYKPGFTRSIVSQEVYSE